MSAAAASGDAFAFTSPWGDGLPLAGQTALVTGAGRGIGRGVAEELAAAGAYVVAADIDAATARDTIGGLAGRGEAAQVNAGQRCRSRLRGRAPWLAHQRRHAD